MLSYQEGLTKKKKKKRTVQKLTRKKKKKEQKCRLLFSTVDISITWTLPVHPTKKPRTRKKSGIAKEKVNKSVPSNTHLYQ